MGDTSNDAHGANTAGSEISDLDRTMANTDPPRTDLGILSSACALLHDHPFDDISYRVLSEAAAVSERTVWRYFPTRAHLLVHLAGFLEFSQMPFPAFRTAQEFGAATRERFRAFDLAPRQALVCARASMTSLLAAPEPDFLTHAVAAMVEEERPGLNPRAQGRAIATLRCVASAGFWAHARLQLAMDGDQAADVVEDVVEQVLAAIPVVPVSAPEPVVSFYSQPSS